MPVIYRFCKLPITVQVSDESHAATQLTYDAIITSLLRQHDVATSLRRNNGVIIASCAHWALSNCRWFERLWCLRKVIVKQSRNKLTWMALCPNRSTSRRLCKPDPQQGCPRVQRYSQIHCKYRIQLVLQWLVMQLAGLGCCVGLRRAPHRTPILLKPSPVSVGHRWTLLLYVIKTISHLIFC